MGMNGVHFEVLGVSFNFFHHPLKKGDNYSDWQSRAEHRAVSDVFGPEIAILDEIVDTKSRPNFNCVLSRVSRLDGFHGWVGSVVRLNKEYKKQRNMEENAVKQ